MIGSPDLLAFTAAEGFGEGEEAAAAAAQSLPEDLSVPLLPASHPWSSSAQFARDFILVAEFSEQVMEPLEWGWRIFNICDFCSGFKESHRCADPVGAAVATLLDVH